MKKWKWHQCYILLCYCSLNPQPTMVAEWVIFQILMNAMMAPSRQFENFKFKFYTRVKFEICVNYVKTCINILLISVDSVFRFRKCIYFYLLPMSQDWVLPKRAKVRVWSRCVKGLKPNIWLKMVAYYSFHKMPRTEYLCHHMFHYHSNNAIKHHLILNGH